MHYLVAELLKLLLKLKLRVGQVLMVLLRRRRAIVIAVWARSSAHLGIWVAVVGGHDSAYCRYSNNCYRCAWTLRVQ